MRSKPNCTIDFEAAEKMYQATQKFSPMENGNPDYGTIIGAYLGWALDEIERMREEAKR